MRIVYIDISHFLASRLNTGIQRVLKEFLFCALSDTLQINAIYYIAAYDSYATLSKKELHALLNDPIGFTPKEPSIIDIFAKRREKKIFLELDAVWNTLPKRADLYSRLKANDFFLVNFIYDLIPLLYPEYMYSQTRENFPQYIEAVAKESDLILFDSHAAKEDYVRLFAENKTPLHVIHLGANISTSTRVPEAYSDILNKKYLLFVGTIEPRKEQLLALQTFTRLHPSHPDLHLVFIGRVGWGAQEFLDQLESHPLKNSHIHHLKNIDDAQLIHFYANAHIVLYLSKYEGYGLPLVEALSHHKLTITSQNSSLVEIGKDFATFLPQNTQKELYKTLEYYLTNPKTHQAQEQHIKERYAPPTWQNTYAQLIKLLNA